MSKHYEALMKLKSIKETIGLDDADFEEIADNETDYKKYIDWALQKYAWHKALAEAAKAMSDVYKAKQKRFERSMDYFKEYAESVLNTVEQKSYKSGVGSIAISDRSGQPVIIDESKIPDRFFKTERVLMKSEINEAVANGEVIDGVSISNGKQVVTIRIK